MKLAKPEKNYEIPPTAGLPILFQDLFARPSLSLGDKLSHWLNIAKPIFTCSGTAALIVALKTLQQQQPRRTKVIVAAYTCPLVALALHHCQPLKLVLCDLLPNSIDMNPEQLAALCDDETLAIVVTHLGGRVADVATASAIAQQHGCFIIEDAAQAMGATVNGQSVGLQGDMAFFSMAVGKGLTTFEGGVLFSKQPQLQQALTEQTGKLLSNNCYMTWLRRLELWGYALCYRPRLLYYAYGQPLRKALANDDPVAAVGDDFTAEDIPLHSLDNYRQAVAAKAFARLPAYLQQGRIRALKRIETLKSIKGLTVLEDNANQQGVWPFIMLLLPNQALRDQAMACLWGKGVGVTRLFINMLADYPATKPLIIEPYKITQANAFAAQSLTITNSHWLDDATFDGIVTELQRILAAA